MMSNYLPENPCLKDLLKFSKIRLRKKRSQKKFIKAHWRYIPRSVLEEYVLKTTEYLIQKKIISSEDFARLF